MDVPFFRPDIGEAEIQEVVDTLRSGWLTTGPKVKRFEQEFGRAVRAKHSLALNSATAALHLAVDALGLEKDQAVLVPTMTVAATAEVILYQRAVPILVDCDPITLNMDLEDARSKIAGLESGTLPDPCSRDMELVGMVPVHVGGLMMSPSAMETFAAEHGIWVVEDGAHAFPAAWREAPSHPWRQCGEGTSKVACFSFYANKTITTGEGGMAVTDSDDLAERMRLMSLHGLSKDPWKRHEDKGSWDYLIADRGFKYNFTDIAAAIGIHQLARAEVMRSQRESLARDYLEAFRDIEELEVPPAPENCLHAWHLFPIKLNLKRLAIDRNRFIEELKKQGVGCSVHWRPLHLHPYYQKTFGWKPEHFPIATQAWKRIISLPVFPSMSGKEIQHVIAVVKNLCAHHGK